MAFKHRTDCVWGGHDGRCRPYRAAWEKNNQQNRPYGIRDVYPFALGVFVRHAPAHDAWLLALRWRLRYHGRRQQHL